MRCQLLKNSMQKFVRYICVFFSMQMKKFLAVFLFFGNSVFAQTTTGIDSSQTLKI